MKRNQLIVSLAIIAVAFTACVPPAFSETKAQKMLKAKRGAQVDAYRKLSEMIKGLQLSATTYVRDFVTESDVIRTRFEDFIKGAKMIGEPRFIEEADGSLTAEVDVQVTLEQVMQGLAEISYDRGPDKPPLDLTYMQEHTRRKEFIATGTANTGRNAPPPGMGPAGETMAQGAGRYGSHRQSPTAGLPGWENVTGQGRLKAERAALTDARRNLLETVHGLRITGNTYVRDFVTESDEIRTAVDGFIKGVKQISPYRYYEDAIVEVDVQVTIQDVIKELTTIRQHLQQKGFLWQRDVFRTVQFEEITGWTEKKVIIATGSGTVHEMDFFDAPPIRQDAGYIEPAPSFAGQVISAVGVGVPAPGETGPAARIRAERAAEMDARRNLVEQIYGVQIDSTTTVRDFVLQNDRVNANVAAFIAGAQRVGEPVYNEDGSVEVTLEIPLDGIMGVIGRR
ncbi:MAG: hypothetical protein RBU23_03230 [Candidatus Auribacterota bacterium]|nr:hypothetical protein [Candidatus Auribacterota bacterium]